VIKPLAALMLTACLLAAGCVGDNAEKTARATTATMAAEQTAQAAQNYSFDDADVPFIDENDTVEIGEMI
jgi:hypothetical protein